MSKAMTAASKEQLIELMQYLSQNISVPTIGIGGGFAPIGTIISYMGTTAPQDYLICDGTTYNIADYKQLSDFFATQFGSANFFGGDGITTFKVPDLRGEFLRGTGTNSHENQGGGANVGVHQNGTGIPNIKSDVNNTYVTSTENFSNGPIYYDNMYHKSGNRYSREFTLKGTSSQQLPAEDIYTTRPTNTSVLYCIKAVAAGDVYSTTERVVGTWIDGKKVYEKTVTGTTPSITDRVNSWIEIVTIANVDDIISLSGRIYDTVFPVTFWSNEDSVTYFCRLLLDGDNIGRIGIQSNRSTFGNKNYKVTIRYTKTTD